MLEFNFYIKVLSIGCIQLLLLLLFKKLNLKKYFNQYQGIQKIHDGEILRIGSLFLFLPLIIIYIINSEFKSGSFNLIIICSSIIIFLTIIEDIKYFLSPKLRLAILFFVSTVYVFFADLPNIKISSIFIDNQNILVFYSLYILSLMMIMNGFNFIDGLNGLSSFNFITIFVSIYFLAGLYQDEEIKNWSTFLILLSLFFLVLNFPFGRFFLGDSGSYLYAFLSGSTIILLFERNSEAPTLLALLVLAYPITEIMFSIIRKSIKKFSPMRPDNLHIHQLIYNKLSGNKKFRNNFASLIMAFFWLSPLLLVILSIQTNLKNINLYLSYLSFYLISYYGLSKK
jgi:UDP-N-acetylmuramyl pentapeptide phosphotransferase/UDP-N-acetylglucosamine-1-phosphate transferase